MRIAISGTASTGKTTLIKDMVKEWPTFTTPTKTYRDLLPKDEHSKATTKELQEKILNFMIDQVQEYGENDKVIFDRCPLDNIVYTLWAHEKGTDGVDHAFVKKCITLVKESMCFYDIIFFIPITKVSPIKIQDDGTRDTDPHYIKEIDTVFKALHQDWTTNKESQFCNMADRPAIIEIFGAPEERIQMLKLYLDVDGDAIDDTGVMDEMGNVIDSSGLIHPYQ
jgi:predicted ATPase